MQKTLLSSMPMDVGDGVDGKDGNWKEACCWDSHNDICDKSSACFPSSAKVLLEDGRLVSMAELNM